MGLRKDLLFSQIEDVAGPTLLGRASGTSDINELTATQATGLLNTFTDAAKGLVPASGGGTSNFLRADGTWASAGGSSLSDGDKGDITISGSGTVWTIDSNITKTWTGVHSWRDNNFSLVDNTDTSKVLQFQLSSIDASTTRTLTIPNIDGTLLLGTGASNRIPYFNSTNVVTTESGFEYNPTSNRLAVDSIGSNTTNLTVTPAGISNTVRLRVQENSSNTYLEFLHTNNNNTVITGGVDSSSSNRNFQIKTANGTSTNAGPNLQLEAGDCSNSTPGNIILLPGLDTTSGSIGQVLINNTSGSGMLHVKGAGSSSNQVILLTNGTGTQLFEINNASNLAIGQAGYGGGTRVISVASANVAPSSNSTDGFIMYGADIVAGNAAPHFRTEAGHIIKLYTTNSGSPYSFSNVTTRRSLDANSYTTDELADLICTFINDIKNTLLVT